jgi:hypothetical protein
MIAIVSTETLMCAQRIFRIFVSSTFGDFQAEREALRAKVWPELQNFCRAQGGDFQAVDLRWGVNESAGLEHETMKICLDEIAHCQRLSPRPNFLILIGDRYGWRPLPPAIPVTEFEAVWGCYAENAEAQALLKRWYWRDENAVPVEYVLQPRPQDYAKWSPVESRLLALLRGAAQMLGITPERRERYFLSATHLETVRGALSHAVPDAGQHVLAFFRTLEDLPAGKDGQTAGKFVDVAPDGTRDPEALRYLNELKAELRQQLSAEPGHVFDYAARWTGVAPFITTNHLNQLCKDVETGLKHLIGEQLARLEQLDRLAAERQAHEDFGRERGRVFVGRAEPLAAIAGYLAEGIEPPRPCGPPLLVQGGEQESVDSSSAPGEHLSTGSLLIVHGPGGSGKSALMARAIQAAGETAPNSVLIQRFIGASPASVGLRALLGGLCQEIARAYGQPEALPEGEMKELIDAFAERLAFASAEQPLSVFIDALDQLVSQDGAMPFEWLPPTLPAAVRLVVSVLDGAGQAELQRRFPDAPCVAVPLVTTAEETEVMLEALLADETSTQPKRQLTEAQRQAVLTTFQPVGLPLWLKLAVTEARRWHSWQTPETLAGSIAELIRQFLDRLQATHGPVLVERALAYLVTSRHGLTDDELLEVLWLDPKARAEFNQRTNPDQRALKVVELPPIIWSRLYFDLEPYLIERAANGVNCYAFFHRQFSEVVMADYCLPPDDRERHAQLAAYFGQQGWRNAKHRAQLRLRTLAELPWQQTQAGQAKDVEATLTDFDFAMAKCEAGEHQDLAEDYRRALAIMMPPSRTFRIWENFFRSRQHILQRADTAWPAHKILLQLAVEHADESPVTQAAERWLESGYCDWVWLRNPQRLKQATLGSCIYTFEREHSSAVLDVRILPRNQLLSWAADNTMCLWDLSNGDVLLKLKSVDIRVWLDGRIITWSDDKILRLWNIISGEITNFIGHDKKVNLFEVFSKNKILSCSDDEVCIWESETGNLLCKGKGNIKNISGFKIISNIEFLFWSYFSEKIILSLFNTESGLIKDLLIINNPSNFYKNRFNLYETGLGNVVLCSRNLKKINDVYLTDDYKLIIWSLGDEKSSNDGFLTYWDLDSHECLMALNNNKKSVNSLVLSDENTITWSGDNLLTFCDRKTTSFESIQLPCRIINIGVVSGIKILILTSELEVFIWDTKDKNLIKVIKLSDFSLKDKNEEIKNSIQKNNEVNDNMVFVSKGVLISREKNGQEHIMESLDEDNMLFEINQFLVFDKIRVLCSGNSEGHLRSYYKIANLYMWDITKHQCVSKKFNAHNLPIEGVLIISESQFLTWSDDHAIKIWDANLKCIGLVKQDVLGIKLLSNNRFLSYANDGKIKLWDINIIIENFTCEDDADSDNREKVDELIMVNEKMALSMSHDGIVRMLNLEKKVEIVDTVYPRFNHPLTGVGMYFIKDFRILLCWDYKILFIFRVLEKNLKFKGRFKVDQLGKNGHLISKEWKIVTSKNGHIFICDISVHDKKISI